MNSSIPAKSLFGTVEKMVPSEKYIKNGKNKNIFDMMLKTNKSTTLMLESSNVKLNKVLSLIEQKNVENEELSLQIKKLNALINEYEDKITEQNEKISQLEEKVNSPNQDQNSFKSGIYQIYPKSSDLLEKGILCSEQNHIEKIEKLRNIVNDLQTKLENMQQIEKNFETSDQSRLEESRSNDHPFKSVFSKIMNHKNNYRQDNVNQPNHRVVEFVTQNVFKKECEAREEMQELFESSEKSHSDLVLKLKQTLELSSNIQTTLKKDNKNHILEERQEFLDQISDKIESMKSDIKKKNEILADFDQNLKIMEESQNYAVNTSKKAEAIATELVKERDEVQVYRALYRKVKTELQTEKRLNEYIKINKTFHLEGEYSFETGWPKHECLRRPKSHSYIRNRK